MATKKRKSKPKPKTKSFNICVIGAGYVGLVAAAWKFPQPWLPMVAGAISVSVQLASPWVPPRERFRRSNGV